MKHLFFLILLLVVNTHAKAQDQLVMKGTILRENDSISLYNAHIYFDGKGIGTTSNESGEFVFHFSEKLKDNKITISSIDSQGNITRTKRAIRVTPIQSNSKEKNKISRETDLYKYSISYNPEFWKNYNAPSETAAEKRIKEEVNGQE